MDESMSDDDELNARFSINIDDDLFKNEFKIILYLNLKRNLEIEISFNSDLRVV